MPRRRLCSTKQGGCCDSTTLLQRSCLKPMYSLRLQLIVSYGFVSLITIALVVLSATWAVLRSGAIVQDETSQLLNDQLIHELQHSTNQTAVLLTKKVVQLQGSATLLGEIVRDRIVGYPNLNEGRVPFVDRDSQQRIYPLKGHPLPIRDRQVRQVVADFGDPARRREQLQERATLLEDSFADILNTETAMLAWQGNCNPDLNDTAVLDCTAANNDPNVGGRISPTSTLPRLAELSADIALLMKPLWEADPYVLLAAVYFHNEGAGATLTFPSFSTRQQDINNSTSDYVSAGCGWMKTVNPYTKQRFGSDADIETFCRPQGKETPFSLYNPMERSFCHDQILHPGETRIFGPYQDSIDQTWRVTVGQAVFDRRTQNFIACTGFDITPELALDLLDSVLINNRTRVAVVRLDGTILAGTGVPTDVLRPYHVVDDEGILDKDSMDGLDQLADWESDRFWDPIKVQAGIDEIVSNYHNGHQDVVISIVPSPLLPAEYDINYVPDFWVVVSSETGDVQSALTSVAEDIQEGIWKLVLFSVVTGVVGLVVFMGIVLIMSEILTRPLKWMELISWRIVNHATQSRISEDLLAVDDKGEETTGVRNKCLGRCSPKTEVRDLVQAFDTMIRSFSGQGSSNVALPKLEEVRNVMTWKPDYSQLYTLNQTLEEQIEEQKKAQTQPHGRRLSSSRARRHSGIRTGTGTKGFRLVTASELGMMSIASELSTQSQAYDEEDATFRSAELRPVGVTPSTATSPNPAGGGASKEAVSTRTNKGSHVESAEATEKDTGATMQNHSMQKSRLFRWVLGCIVCPLLITIIVICVLVKVHCFNALPGAVKRTESMAMNLNVEGIRDSASLHALHASQLLPGALRDLHLLTRTAGWLLFGGIERTDTFTDVEMEFVEECKDVSETQQCPYEADDERSPCDCQWNDPWFRDCRDYTDRDTRDLQQAWYMCQASDYDPVTGARNFSSRFSDQVGDFSPETTDWWDDVVSMPGFEKGSNASSYSTTYDRLRVISALAVATFPIYNHVNADRKQNVHSSMASYTAFDADGAFTGFAGCNHDFARYAVFQSSDTNGAYKVNASLCPRDKFGYDPRCRRWYDDAKQKSLGSDTSVHVTAPYSFASDEEIGVSAVSSLLDPRTGDFVGTTLVDLMSSEVFSILESSNQDLSFVISPSAPDDADTITSSVRPINTGYASAAIADVILPNDSPVSEDRTTFGAIVKRMKEGATGDATFSRRTDDGQSEEIQLSFAPVYVRTLNPVRPDDYGRGSQVSQMHLYSVAVGKKSADLGAPIEGLMKTIRSRLSNVLALFFTLIVAITLFSLFLNIKISIGITMPMVLLLNVVRHVNDSTAENDIPPLTGGSREVTQVYSSFAKLYKIIRMSNASFFAGSYKWAHHIASDAHKLFTKIEDEKAVGITSNNIGNTVLALMIQNRQKDSCLKVDGECAFQRAVHHFDDAIDISTNAFNESETDADKANYAQQLADRHFNRAVCLLYCLDDPCCPSNATEMAMTDLLRCKEYDRGVQEFFLHEKLMFKYSDICFERQLRRLHGLAILYNIDPSVWQLWDINELVDGADMMLQAAWEQDNAPLFQKIDRVGRLQQLEGAVIGLELCSDKTEEAARMAMRMLTEDEYIIDSSFVVAADSIIRYMRDPRTSPWAPEATLRTSLELRRMRRAGKRTALDTERSFLFCLEMGASLAGSTTLRKLRNELLDFFDNQCNGNDSVGIVAMATTGAGNNLVVSMSKKEETEATQRHGLVQALDQLGDNHATSHSDGSNNGTVSVDGEAATPALPLAVNMVTNAASSTTSEVFLIYISDGSQWDKDIYNVITKKLKNANSLRSGSIDVMVVGLDNNNTDGVDNDDFLEGCRNMCLATHSRNSKYLSANEYSMGDVFESLGSLISSSSSAESNRLQLALTMERF